jgi:CIC family chloride channel protein
VLSSGHGALHLDLTTHLPLIWIGGLLTLKCLASGISLGFGFRGGLFFASLFMGTWSAPCSPACWHGHRRAGDRRHLGRAGRHGSTGRGGGRRADDHGHAGAEGTHDFLLTSVVMSAVLVSSTLARQWFGLVLDLAHAPARRDHQERRDVGWVQNLNAGRLMRKGVATAPADLDAAAFRQRFPLGSGSRVVLIDGEGHRRHRADSARLRRRREAGDRDRRTGREPRRVAAACRRTWSA